MIMTASEHLARVSQKLHDKGVVSLHVCWEHGAKDKYSPEELGNLLAAALDVFLTGKYKAHQEFDIKKEES